MGQLVPLHHVCNIRAGPEYVSELGRMMDGAEKDILALKDAQRTAFDALMREERELTRHVEDFAARVDVWDSDKSDPTWAGGGEASTSAPGGGAGGASKASSSKRPGSAAAGGRRPGSAAAAGGGGALEPWARAAASNSPKVGRERGWPALTVLLVVVVVLLFCIMYICIMYITVVARLPPATPTRRARPPSRRSRRTRTRTARSRSR
jgi:cobalamin biosynthesis Mg chelatase CobN